MSHSGTTQASDAPLNVLVCGTTFGRVHLKAIAALPEQFRLVGILARGSEHSKAVAAEYGVPFYQQLAELPTQGIDCACVVVRAGVVGGPGAELAEGLLARGIAVLQESPLHLNEISRCLQASRNAGRPWVMNSFYPDVAPVARFIRLGQALRQRSRITSLEISASVHVLYPLIEILAQLLGGLRPWRFSELLGYSGPFSLLSAEISGVPATLRIQNQINPQDPDNHTELFHRIALASEAGTLLLTDTHGSVLWQPRLHVPRNAEGQLTMFEYDQPALQSAVQQVVAAVPVPDYGQLFNQLWPEAMRWALLRFAGQLRSGDLQPARQQATLAACQCWQALGQALGPTEAFQPEVPVSLSLAELEACL